MSDNRGMCQTGVGAALVIGHIWVKSRQALDVRLVDDGVGPGGVRSNVATPIEVIINDDTLGYRGCRIDRIDDEIVSALMAEYGGVPQVVAVDRFGVGVKQDLGRVPPLAVAGIPRTGDSEPVSGARGHRGHVRVKNVMVTLGELSADLVSCVIECGQVHAGGPGGPEGHACAAVAVWSDAKGIPRRPGVHAPTVPVAVATLGHSRRSRPGRGEGVVADFVEVDVHDGVATILLNRPKMNALNLQMQREIHAAAEEIAGRADIGAVVLHGGPKVFAAGADVKEMADMSFQEMSQAAISLQGSFTALAQIPQPTIAAITGYALGGGCELAMCCDMRIAADDAQLGQPEILLGIIPGAGGTQRLPRLVGPARAKELILTGRFVSAEESLRIGLVEQVVPSANVLETALALAKRLARGPAFATRAAKEAVDRGLETDLVTGLAMERVLFASLFATEDQKLGMASFVENGPGKATFTGR